ncbi:hypothetical protein BDV59DRAFT_201052 [Aspergillus ambiguus]|uniref:uncharacterized protein n=1 Tax=Aspergillus ambiguus TaxID=176160 RepID=UPI003CCCFF1D
MKVPLVAPVLLGSVFGRQHQHQHPLYHDNHCPQQLALEEEDCHVSRMSAFDSLVPGPVPFSEPANPLYPYFRSLNTTTGEQWEFDAISPDGTAGVLIAFYRDPEFSFLGPGNLRINIDVAFPDGKTASLIDYAEQSVVEACTEVVTGTWLRAGASYQFRIATDSSWASLILDAPSINGTIDLKNIANPRSADGSIWKLSSESDSTNYSTISGMHWMEPMPAARSSASLTAKGIALSIIDGIGGAERLWQSRTWFDMLKGYTFFRIVAGPYTISYWSSVCKDDGSEVGNVMLWHEGNAIFASSDRAESSRQEGIQGDFFVYQPTYSGTVRSSVGEHTPTGYNLRMISPSRGTQWTFHLEHKRVLFEFNLGRGAGGTAFMGRASGGQRGREQFEGTFLNEAVDLSNLWIPAWVSLALWAFHYTWACVKGNAHHILNMVAAYRM